MKNINLFFCSLFLLTSAEGVCQRIIPAEGITAVQLNKELTGTYNEGAQVLGFSVDKTGVLRPTEGYEIIYRPRENTFAVIPEGIDYPEANYDSREIPGGVMFCLCAAENDNCKINVMVGDNTIYYHCDGGCSCGAFTIFSTSKPILDYETRGGQWFNL